MTRWHELEDQPVAWTVHFYGRAWFYMADNLDMGQGDTLPMVLGERFEWLELWESFDTMTGPTIEAAIEAFTLTNPGFSFEILSAHPVRNSRKKPLKRTGKGASSNPTGRIPANQKQNRKCTSRASKRQE